MVRACGPTTTLAFPGQLSLTEDRVDEDVRIEVRQVIGTLTEPHDLDGDAKLALDLDDDAALGGPVELRQDYAGDVDNLGEDACLPQAILAGSRVEHEQHLVHRAVLLD